MKKYILVSLLLIGALCVGYAQATYGIRLGGNLNEINDDYQIINMAFLGSKAKFDKTELGFNLGVFMNYPINRYIILQPEINYSQRGGRREGYYEIWHDGYDDWQTDWVHDTFRMHYLELPLYFKGDFRNGNLSLQPYMGPEFRYLIKGRFGRADSPDDEFIVKDMDELNGFDAGLGFGFDLAYMDKYMLGVRYSEGFREIIITSLSRTKSLQLNLGYKF
ncbi:MAG: porin family protein [Candidatus Cloacimonadaceae bacterium]